MPFRNLVRAMGLRVFQKARPKSPRVRPLPFPFRGAVAVSNDIEFTSFEWLEAFMRWLNTTQDTPLGRGLGLEVCSSLFFHSCHPYTFSYFSGAEPGAAASADAPRIAEYLRTGWLDTIHAWGDFDFKGGFVRAHAQQALEELDRLGVTLSVFTNHGTVDNVQNMGGDAAYHRGDVSSHPAYHADLTVGHGVRYVWTDSRTVERLPGAGIVPGLGWMAGELKKTVLGRPLATDDALVPFALRDGNQVLGMNRVRGTYPYAPNLTNAGQQMELVNLDRLCREDGVAFLYQHFGVQERGGESWIPASVAGVLNHGESFLDSWRALAAKQEQGELWVAGTARLARYLDVISQLEVRKTDEGVYDLTPCEGVTDPQRELQGVTIRVDEPGATLRYDGKILWTRGKGENLSMVPLQPLEDIWR